MVAMLNAGDVTRPVMLGVDDQCVFITGKMRCDAVNTGHDDTATTKGRGDKFNFSGMFALQPDHGRVRMGIGNVCRIDQEVQPLCMGDVEAFRYAFVIRTDSHDSGDDGPVRPVAGAGHGERTVQENFGFDGFLTEQLAGNQADFDGTCGM